MAVYTGFSNLEHEPVIFFIPGYLVLENGKNYAQCAFPDYDYEEEY